MKTGTDTLAHYDYMLSHQYTGVDLALVEKEAQSIITTWQNANIPYFYSNEYDAWFKEQGWDYDTTLAWCITEQKKAKKMLFMIVAPRESNGMQAELALAQSCGMEGMLLIKASVADVAWAEPFRAYCSDVRVFKESVSEVL